MTPKQAQDVKLELLGCMDPADVSEHLKDAAATIAAQSWQYGAQCDSCDRLIWRVRRKDAESLVAGTSIMYPECSYRLVRRMVGPTEVVE